MSRNSLLNMFDSTAAEAKRADPRAINAQKIIAITVLDTKPSVIATNAPPRAMAAVAEQWRSRS
jgi:hypothetical protein